MRIDKPGKAFEDSSLGLQVFSDHVEEMGEFNISESKLNYRKMMSLERLLDNISGKIQGCRNEILKTSMLESLSIYLIELIESCEMIIKMGVVNNASKNARKFVKKFDWMKKELEVLSGKQRKSQEFTEKIKKSLKEIPIEKNEQTEIVDQKDKESQKEKEKQASPASITKTECDSQGQKETEKKNESNIKFLKIESIAKQGMLEMLNNETQAKYSSEFERQLNSFKENYNFIFKYLAKYSDLQLKSFYSKKKAEYSLILKITTTYHKEMTTTETPLEVAREAKRVLEIFMNINKSDLAFKMMIKKEKRSLKEVLEFIKEYEQLDRFEQYCKRFKLPCK